MGIATVAAAYGVDRKTVSRWVSKYSNCSGAALERNVGSGWPRKLEELTEGELSLMDLQGAISFGFETYLWTVGCLSRVIQDEFRIQLSKNTIWRRLHETKWIRYEVPKIRRAFQKHHAFLYFQDESNFSLTAFLGKPWHRVAKRPT